MLKLERQHRAQNQKNGKALLCLVKGILDDLWCSVNTSSSKGQTCHTSKSLPLWSRVAVCRLLQYGHQVTIVWCKGIVGLESTRHVLYLCWSQPHVGCVIEIHHARNLNLSDVSCQDLIWSAYQERGSSFLHRSEQWHHQGSIACPAMTAMKVIASRIFDKYFDTLNHVHGFKSTATLKSKPRMNKIYESTRKIAAQMVGKLKSQ